MLFRSVRSTVREFPIRVTTRLTIASVHLGESAPHPACVMVLFDWRFYQRATTTGNELKTNRTCIQ
ncbi:hypothetical protein CEE69_28475 [Rhodopirellula bahusiensis]|uniref:Uncharacterized protein n=1 Tax=Rhodopirellula bahusiensis TaxID=2014065 RepID=A0A2G1VYQ6_9BACT|nr:hypothetical protein CEE69_28475 [Rhodopirellula bahusiensis]